jgi:tetratricopeptide (TPR) repeat protein
LSGRPTVNIPEFAGVSAKLDATIAYDDALQVARKAYTAAQASADIARIANASKAAGECLRRLGRLDEAAEAYEEAARLFDSVGDSRGSAWSEWTQSNLLRQRAEYRDSLELASSAFRRAIASADRDCANYALAGFAEVLRIIGRYRVAWSYHIAALASFRRREDIRGCVWAYEGLGQMCKNVGRLDLAEPLFARALSLADSSGDLRGLAYALKGVGEVSNARHGGMRGIRDLHTAKTLFADLRLDVGLGYTLKSLGQTLGRTGDADNAHEAFGDCRQIFERLEDPRGIAYLNLSVGTLLRLTGARSAAADYLVDAEDRFHAHGIRYGLRNTRGELRALGIRIARDRSSRRLRAS